MDPTPRPAAAFLPRAVAVFGLLLVAYLANGDFLPGNDAKPNTFLPVSVLGDGDLTFTPSEVPFMFVWEARTPGGAVHVPVRSWDERLGDRSARERFERGELVLVREKYYLVPTRRPDHYVSMYGPGPGLVALPAFAALRAAVGDLERRPRVLWYGGKVVASVLVAASGALVFLTAVRFVPAAPSMLLALAYGLGTCVWSTASQALWQHAPNVAFLALGTYLLTRTSRSAWAAAGSGLAFGCAFACRPVGALVLAAVGVDLLVRERRRLAPFAGAAAIPALLLLAYNTVHFGAPHRFGQTLRGLQNAATFTGAAGVWQTPLFEGLAAHLISPSRGLLVFSPFLGFAAWGAVRIWRDRRYAALRPLTLAVAGMLVLSSKWYFWWGGWSYGYRLILDTTVLATSFLVPVVARIVARRALLALFVLAVGWSVSVQVLGAFAYNLRGFNAPVAAYVVEIPGQTDPVSLPDRGAAESLARERGGRVARVERLDVSDPRYRHRLWSWRDSQIVYYLKNFREARREKREMIERWLRDPAL